MRKKRVRNRVGLKEKKFLIYLCAIMMFFLGTSYSLLSQNLNLSGTLTVEPGEESYTDVSLTASVDSTNYEWATSVGKTITLTINNENDYEVKNWTAVIKFWDYYTTGMFTVSTDDSNINATCEKGIITLSPNEASESYTIAPNTSITVQFTIKPKYGFAIWSVSSVTATGKTLANVNEVASTAYSNYSLRNTETSEEKLNQEATMFSKKQNNILFNVEYKENLTSEGKYQTDAIISITNENSQTIKNLSFDLIYKEKNESYSTIKTTVLEQTYSSEEKSSYKMLEYDDLEPNETKIYQIENFITDEKLDEFNIQNIEYENVENTTFENVVETDSNKI